MKRVVVLFFVLILAGVSYAADVVIKALTEDLSKIKYVVVDGNGHLLVKGDTNVYVVNFPALQSVYDTQLENLNVDVNNFPSLYVVYSDSYADIINAIQNISSDTNVYVINFPEIQGVYDTQLENLAVDIRSGSVTIEGDVVTDTNVYVVNLVSVYDTQLENLSVGVDNFPSLYVVYSDSYADIISAINSISLDTKVYVINFPNIQSVYDTQLENLNVNIGNFPSIQNVYDTQLEGTLDVKPAYLNTDYDTSFILSDTNVAIVVNGYFEIWGDTDVILDWNGVEHTLPLSVLRVYKSDFYVGTLNIRNANGVADGRVEIIKVGR